MEQSFEIVAIGASLGGINALKLLLAELPKNFPLPVVIVQHRDEEPDSKPRKVLQNYSALPIVEVEDKEVIAPGRIYLAPAGYHLLVDKDAFALSTEAPVLHARPSIDVLFETTADSYRERAIGIVLTGASKDGAQGATRIKERGGIVIVQDPSTAESSVMPQAAIDACSVDYVLPMAEIARFLTNLLAQQKALV